MRSSYSYFDHDADIGIIGCGETAEAAFVAAAEAMFAIMTDITTVSDVIRIQVGFEESDLGLALVTWLNNLLTEARMEGLIFSRFALQRNEASWHGEAWGEPWRAEMERGVEVKGATLTMLSVKQVEAGWEARCVVDV
jgi:SHS2 domain-containing protein